MCSTLLVSPESSCLCRLNSIEPPWYGPVCPVVWEGWRRETSPYPDQWHFSELARCPTLVHWHEADLSVRSDDVRSSGQTGLSAWLSTSEFDQGDIGRNP